MYRILLYKYVSLVDYEKSEIDRKEVSDDLNDYILKLYNVISESEKLQFFKIKDLSTQVVGIIIDVVEKLIQGETQGISEKMDVISERLREKESLAQEKIDHLGVKVKKGSLIQSVFHDTEKGIYEYLISKTEHSQYMQEESYKLDEGFKVDENNLWKSCIITFEYQNNKINILEVRVYLDNSAKYWTQDFLELVELRNAEQNTQQLFRQVENVLKKDLYKKSIDDYHVLRNSLIEHIRSSDQIDYPKLIKEKFEKYKYSDNFKKEDKDRLVEKLYKLSENQKFDTQFEPVADALTARVIKESYEVTKDIELIIKDINSNDKIKIKEEDMGKTYIMIETDNSKLIEKYR